MADREERRFAEAPRESVKLVAESAGVELSDDVAALLAEDVCYRLREATQVRKARWTICTICPVSTCTCRSDPFSFIFHQFRVALNS